MRYPASQHSPARDEPVVPREYPRDTSYLPINGDSLCATDLHVCKGCYARDVAYVRDTVEVS